MGRNRSTLEAFLYGYGVVHVAIAATCEVIAVLLACLTREVSWELVGLGAIACGWGGACVWLSRVLQKRCSGIDRMGAG